MGMLKADDGTAQVFGLPVSNSSAANQGPRAYRLRHRGERTVCVHDVEQAIRFTRPFFPKWRDDLEQRFLRMFEPLAAPVIRAVRIDPVTMLRVE